MKKPAESGAIDIAAVQSRMLTIRNQQVLLDRDVAALYGVETKALNQAVKRNAERFEDGYLFQLDAREVENWKSQIVTSNLPEREIASLKMGVRRAPYAFTERGLYMLATILNSDRAVRATKAIIETYAKVRSMVSRHGGDTDRESGIAVTGKSAHPGRSQACGAHRRQSLHRVAEDDDRA